MKNEIGKIQINYSEYKYFCSLPATDQLDYFFQLFQGEVVKHTVDLKEFFTQLDKDYTENDSPAGITYSGIPDNQSLVDIMIDDECIMIESDSLKSIRLVTTRFAESGYILSRDLESEKMFKKDKKSRFLRAYYIIDQTTGICLN